MQTAPEQYDKLKFRDRLKGLQTPGVSEKMETLMSSDFTLNSAVFAGE